MNEPEHVTDAAVEAVARVINGADNEWADAPRTMPHEVWPVHVARAVLATPVVADAFAAVVFREKVREIVGKVGSEDDLTYGESAEMAVRRIAVMLRGDGA